jgi:predicted ATPase/tRNA A-37 threonylcarbamoyl transferase component Bud32
MPAFDRMNLQPGTTFGAYEILSAIGEGGLAEVYKARDARLNRVVAIKVLRAQLSSDPEARQSLEREAQIVARLNHPNICTLYNIGEQDGFDYLVMEYLEGHTLAERLQEGALPVDEALKIAIDVADALDKAHQNGVVHRDLKPSNIMLTSSGPKLLDFGLAKPLRASNIGTTDWNTTASAHAGPGMNGTLAYVAPESLEGSDADEKVDVWGFGCVLYEMLTGKPAFGQRTLPETVAQILKHDPDWHLLPASTPLSIHALLRVCLAKERNDRPARMINIMHALKQPAITVPKHNLPQQLNTFVGREEEIHDICSLVAQHRLLTLTGPGGVGKTRLALQVGQKLLHDFPDGVWFAEFAAIVDSQFAGQVVATAVGVREQPARPITESLFEYLESRNALIILDNCEHIAESAAAIAEEILNRSKGMKIIATGRRSLNLPQERSWRVPPLSMPPNRSADVSIEELNNYDAIRLFLDRARSVSPEFVLTANNSGAVLEICNRLDGIPLAIELAAARIRVLSPRQIGERLSDRFALLRDQSRTMQPRHQSLQATLDWSYDLLSDQEKQVFRQLAAFSGGWTLEAAEAICVIDGSLLVLEVLSCLTDKCLVQTKSFQDGMRFEFTETIRQYAFEKLKRAGELPVLNDRHLDYFAGVALQAESKLQGPAQQAVLEDLAAENDNLRAALTWGLQVNPALALRLANSLWEYWRIRGRLVEAEGWLVRAITQELSEQDQVMKAKALWSLGWIAVVQGKPQSAMQFSEEALKTFREKNDEYGVARCLGNLGQVALYKGEYERAGAVFEEALSIARRLGNSRSVAATLGNLGVIARRVGDPHKARDYWELALEIARGLQDQWMIAAALNNLGLAYQDQNDLSTAEKLWSESLAIRRRLADHEGIANGLFNLAIAAFEKGEYDVSRRQFLEALTYYYELQEAANLASAFMYLAKVSAAKEHYRNAAVLLGSAALQQELSLGPWSPREARIYRDLTSVLEEKLGKESFSDAVVAGHSMTTEQALIHARSGDN